MNVPKLNTFCRLNDLVFVEIGSKKGEEVFWFLDATNKRKSYLENEVERRVDACLSDASKILS
jgi:hypothetical protein